MVMKELATFDENVFNQMMRHVKFAQLKGYDVVIASIYGSQNYALESKESDVDSYLVVMPSLEDLALNRKPVSKELMYVDENGVLNGEHVVVKDFRIFVEALMNADFHALEVASSKYTTAIRWTDLDEKVNPFEDMDCFTAVLFKFYWRVANCFESALKSRKLERLDWNKKGDRKTLVDIVLHYFVFLHAFERDKYPYSTYSKNLRDTLLEIKNGSMSKEDALAMFDLNTMLYNVRDRWEHDQPTDKGKTENQLRKELNQMLINQFEAKFEELR